MADDDSQPVWVQGANGPIPTTPEMAQKLGLAPVDMTNYNPNAPPPPTANPSWANAANGIPTPSQPSVPRESWANIANGTNPGEPQPPSDAPPASPPQAPPAPAAAPPQQLGVPPQQQMAPLPPVRIGGGSGGPGIGALTKAQNTADAATLAAQQAANPANVEAAGIIRNQATGGIAAAQAEDVAAQQARQAYVQQRDARIQAQQKLLEDDRADKIDPNKFWADRSTGQHVLASLGVALGAIGQGVGGGPNIAASMIDKAIDRDYEAQKANIANKRANTSAQGDFVKQVNDAGLSDVEAKDLHRIRALDTVQKNVELLAKTATTPQAQAQAQASLAQIQQEKATHMTNLAKTSSDLATQAVSRGHMGLENQLLIPEVQMARLRAQNPGAFVNPENVAILGGQKVNLGQGIKGEDLTKAWQNHQRLIETIDKTLPAAGSSLGIPFTPSAREGEARASELKDALAGVSKTSPRLQKEEFANRIGSNAFSTWGATPEKLRMLRENAKSSLVDELESKGLNPTAAKSYVEQKFPTAQ